MKNFTFRVTQDLKAYYEGRVTVRAKDEESALAKLEKMSQKKLEDLCDDWEQCTGNAESEGDIEIQELKDVE